MWLRERNEVYRAKNRLFPVLACFICQIFGCVSINGVLLLKTTFALLTFPCQKCKSCILLASFPRLALYDKLPWFSLGLPEKAYWILCRLHKTMKLFVTFIGSSTLLNLSDKGRIFHCICFNLNIAPWSLNWKPPLQILYNAIYRHCNRTPTFEITLYWNIS